MKTKGKTVEKGLGEPEPHDLGWAGGSFFTLSAGRETEQENLLSHQLYTPLLRNPPENITLSVNQSFWILF